MHQHELYLNWNVEVGWASHLIMSSKRKPVSATFKRESEKGTAQRSKPLSVKSNSSIRHNVNSSLQSDSSGLSITGTKTATSRSHPTRRQSLDLSFEKSSSRRAVEKKNKKNSSDIHGLNEIANKETDFTPTLHQVEKFEAEKDDPWWESLPDEVLFSPSSSLSYASSKSDLSKPYFLSRENEVQPTLNDFLDITDDSNTNVADRSENLKDDVQNFESDARISLSSLNGRKSFDEAVPRNSNLIPKLVPNEKPQSVFWNSSKISGQEKPHEVISDSRKANFTNSSDHLEKFKEEPTNDINVAKRRHSEVSNINKKHPKQIEAAALVIQRTYRGYRSRLQAGYSAVQRALNEKRLEVEKVKKLECETTSSVEQRREEKAKQARQKAIKELNEKRIKRKEDQKRMVEEDLKFLEDSGKVKTAKKKTINEMKKSSKKMTSKRTQLSREVETIENESRSSSARSLDSKVEEIFQESRKSTQQTDTKPVVYNDKSDGSTSRSVATAAHSGTKSTLDELFESLRQLEEEPNDIKKPTNDAATQNLSYEHASKHTLTEDSLRNSTTSSGLSQVKLRTIMSFLDEVEKTDQDTVVSRVHDANTFHESSSVATSVMSPAVIENEKEIALLESASAAASDVTNAMMSVKVELEEKKKTNDLLQRALTQQRDFTLRQARDMEKDTKQRLNLQRQEYESTIQRHLSFIDQLIDDKKILSERCEELVKKLKETDKKYVDKISKMEENHAAEVKKQKDVMLTAEKLRREKWIKDKSQQIKELTVKGLEPDIQKLIAKHKTEIKRLKSAHQAELLETDERVGRRYLQQIEELRDQLEREKESACNRERELAQSRYQKQMEEEEKAFQQQRRRLYGEIQEEKERLANQLLKQRKELDDLKEKLEDSHKTAMKDVESSSKQVLEELENKHQNEMKELSERMDVEKQQWIENYMKKQDAVLLQKERELKESVRESRDKEIELVIRRLEEETSLARDECERAAENRIKRVRDKYETEIKDIESSERIMHEKYTSAKEKSTELEEEVSRLKSLLKNEERKMDDLNKLTKQLQEERGQVVDIIRQEFADRLVTTDEDNKRLKIEISELRAKHRLEIERINNAKEEEMEEVHKRVKQAISRKEETLNSLRQHKESAEKRADHLEFLLHEQRKKLLS